QFESRTHLRLGNAIDNLQENSGAIQGLNSVSSPFPMHFVVGVSNSNDETLADQGLVSAVRSCNEGILPEHIRTLFGGDSDLVVGVSSQRKDLSSSADGTTDTGRKFGNSIHTDAVILEGQT